MGIIKEYKYIYQHKKEWVQDDLIAVFLALLMISVALVVVLVYFYVHDLSVKKEVGPALTSETSISKLEDGYTMHVEDYTVLLEYKTESESGTVRNCVLGIVDTKTWEIRYILPAAVDFSKIDVENIGKSERLPGTERVLFHAPFKGKLSSAAGQIPEEVREQLKEQGMSDAEIDAKAIPFSLAEVEATGKINLLLAGMYRPIGFWIFVGLMLLGTIVSGVLHYKFQKERNRGFFTF